MQDTACNIHRSGQVGKLEDSMSDSEFLELVDATLDRIEDRIDLADADIEPSRTGMVLTLEFDNGSKIIINGQAAMRELWVAAKAGAYHYRHDGQAWRDTRDQTELFATLSRLASAQAGTVIALQP